MKLINSALLIVVSLFSLSVSAYQLNTGHQQNDNYQQQVDRNASENDNYQQQVDRNAQQNNNYPQQMDRDAPENRAYTNDNFQNEDPE